MREILLILSRRILINLSARANVKCDEKYGRKLDKICAELVVGLVFRVE